jgi:hypothetical protein
MPNRKKVSDMMQSARFWRAVIDAKLAILRSIQRDEAFINAGIPDDELLKNYSRERILSRLGQWVDSCPEHYIGLSQIRMMLWYLSYNTPYGELTVDYLVHRRV